MGSVGRARSFAARLGAPIAIVDKRRPRENESEVMNIIGNVEGRHALLIDDMIDTAGTITMAADQMMQNGARSVRVVATHPVLSGPAYERIMDSAIEEVVVTDSIPLQKECSKIKVISCAELFADVIHKVYNFESISSKFIF